MHTIAPQVVTPSHVLASNGLPNPKKAVVDFDLAQIVLWLRRHRFYQRSGAASFLSASASGGK
jgi:hypothetical protein